MTQKLSVFKIFQLCSGIQRFLSIIWQYIFIYNISYLHNKLLYHFMPNVSSLHNIYVYIIYSSETEVNFLCACLMYKQKIVFYFLLKWMQSKFFKIFVWLKPSETPIQFQNNKILNGQISLVQQYKKLIQNPLKHRSKSKTLWNSVPNPKQNSKYDEISLINYLTH